MLRDSLTCSKTLFDAICWSGCMNLGHLCVHREPKMEDTDRSLAEKCEYHLGFALHVDPRCEVDAWAVPAPNRTQGNVYFRYLHEFKMSWHARAVIECLATGHKWENTPIWNIGQSS